MEQDGVDPGASSRWCQDCRERQPFETARAKINSVPVVDLPFGATEDRVTGALDLRQALAHGIKTFEPGLLARANRGFLYIDEANLLEDHIVDHLLDVAALGENLVEPEGPGIRHPARFVLVGSSNPGDGELRPRLLDRLGLSGDVRTPETIALYGLPVRNPDHVAGPRDCTIPPADTMRVGALTPIARSVLLPGLGHLVHEKKPAEIAALILSEVMAKTGKQ